MALYDYQKLNRLLPGRPFGTGSDGDLQISADTTLVPTTAVVTSGTSGTTSLAATNNDFAAGQIIMIVEICDSSMSGYTTNWELNKIASYTAGTITTTKALSNTYGTVEQPSNTLGSKHAFVVVRKQYRNVVIDSAKTFYATAYNESLGGMLPFDVSGTLTVTGTLNMDSRGYYGGNISGHPSSNAYFGEGHFGGGVLQKSAVSSRGFGLAPNNFGMDGITQTENNSSGGGGDLGSSGHRGGGGGGGGNGSAGTLGVENFDGGSQNASGGVYGKVFGVNTMVKMFYGGGGGSGGSGGNDPGGSGSVGGYGGGAICIFAKKIVITGGISVKGQAGSNNSGTWEGAGGGGAGGSVLLCGQFVDIGTDKIDVTGGAGGTNNGSGGDGGAGGKGVVTIYYGSSLSGSLGSSYYGLYLAERDSTLVQTSAALMAVL